MVNVSPGVTGISFFQLNPPPPPAPDVELPELRDAAPCPPPPITTALIVVVSTGTLNEKLPGVAVSSSLKVEGSTIIDTSSNSSATISLPVDVIL
jgi:hypothetical protein